MSPEDEELCSAVAKATDELNGALLQAADAGLAIELQVVDVRRVQDVGPHPMVVVRQVSRLLRWRP